MKFFISLLVTGSLFLFAGVSFSDEGPSQSEKLIFHSSAEAFDTLWNNLKAEAFPAELPQRPGSKFAVKRFRTAGLTVICLVNLDDKEKRQCDFYVENHQNAYTNKDIGGVIEFKGAAAKSIAANFNLKGLWHQTDNLLQPGQKIWRAGYAIIEPAEQFLWEFYYDGAQYYAHFSRVWNPKFYVFDMFERKSTELFDPRTDTFPRKIEVPGPSGGGVSREIDDLFLRGMRESFFGDRRRQGMGE